MHRFTRVVFAAIAILICAACTSTTSTPAAPVSCEQHFDRDLANGVSYTVALGRYTQCLIDRGDTVRDAVSA